MVSEDERCEIKLEREERKKYIFGSKRAVREFNTVYL